MSAREIARAVGTSDATVVRTAKTLGYVSLRQLRQALAEDEEADLSTRLQATIGDSPSAHDVLATAIDRHLEALNTLVRRVPAADFDDAARILSEAAYIWWSGPPLTPSHLSVFSGSLLNY